MVISLYLSYRVLLQKFERIHLFAHLYAHLFDVSEKVFGTDDAPASL